MTAPRLSVRVVRTLEEFERLPGDWNELIERAMADNVFLTWEWLFTWAKHYLDGRSLRIVLVYDRQHRLVGLAPFYLHRHTAWGLARLRELRFLGTEEVCSSYLDIIAPAREKRAVVERVYQYLHGEASGEWDLVTLAEIPAESATIGLWDQLVQEAGRVVEMAGTTACPYISLNGGLEAFLRGLTRSGRYNLQRKGKRLERAGRVACERASSPAEVEEALVTFIGLHQARWAAQGVGGAFLSERFLAFHRELVKVFGERGWVRVHLLSLDDEPIAGVYGYRYKGRYSFYLPGFNPTACPEASPGILLLFRCIKDAIEEGLTDFDLLRGTARYKLAWADGLRQSLTLRHYNRHLRSAAAKCWSSGRDIVKVLVR